MALQVGYETLSNNKHKKLGNKNGSSVIDPGNSQSSEAQQSTRDDLLENEGWLSPQEYYGSISTNVATTAAYSEDTPVDAGGRGTTIPTYFWLEEIKNWATFTMYYGFNESMRNAFYLQVWNGRDDWCFLNLTEYSRRIIVAPEDDKYNIGGLQNIFLDDVDLIRQVRGISTSMNTMTVRMRTVSGGILHHKDYDFNYSALNARYNQSEHYLQVINAIRLKRQTKYGINKKSNFQTLTYGTSNIFTNSSSLNVSDHVQTNFRSALTYGCPAVWRLPTGELALCIRLEWNVDNGKPYYYKKRGYCKEYKQYPSDYGFKKYFNPNYLNNGSVYADHIIDYQDLAKSENYINERCREFFGNGNDKTIEKDWLNNNPITVSRDEYSSATGVQGSMLDSELIFEQYNINKENSLKCGFKINRPIVTTTERPNQDYAKKW